jgi:hypothetical protein
MQALITIYDEKYKPLADLTWHQNKVPYAKRHGYDVLAKTDNFNPDIKLGFQKIWWLKSLMVERPDIEWFWWTGCDTLITNWTTKIEDKISNDHHFILASDCNGLNSDSFLLRNSVEGRNFIDHLWSIEPKLRDHKWEDQQAIIDSVDQFKDIIKIVPQKEMNAYNTAIYNNQSNLDLYGNDGTWRPGDWLIHWPGLSLERRIWLACFYRDYIIK